MKGKNSPNIFAYINYRTYLKDFYEAKKKSNPKFSYRLFSRLAGFSSPNFFKLVILSQRNLSVESLDKVCAALKIKAREADFFSALVAFNQSRTHQEKKFFFEKLRYFKEFDEIKNIDRGSYEYLSKWYHVAIRELTLVSGFRENPFWISEKLNGQVSPQQVMDSLKLLEKLKLIRRNADNQLRPTSRNLSTEPEILDLSVSDLHHQMIRLAADSVDKTPAEYRDISAVTIAVDRATFLEAKKRIQNFRRELNVLLSACKKPDAVYQLNFQLFNLTQVPWKNTSSGSQS